jgi:hypothetical protein
MLVDEGEQIVLFAGEHGQPCEGERVLRGWNRAAEPEQKDNDVLDMFSASRQMISNNAV